MTRIPWLIVLALLATLIFMQISASWASEPGSTGSALAQGMAFLFPIGLTLVTWSALPADRSDNVAGLATLALALALVGYLATGFGFHFGGAASVTDIPQLQTLSRFFSLARGNDGALWGVFGLEGFFLGGDAATPAAVHLFLSQVPMVTSMALVVMLGFPRKTPLPAHMVTGFIASAVTFPLAGHWVNGGGWLAHLGDSLGLGHGLVDFSSTATVFTVGGATVLASAWVFGRRRPAFTEPAPNANVPMPPSRFPLLAAIGALFCAIGWLALGLANPLYADAGNLINWSRVFLNALVGLAGGTLAAQLYSGFTTGRFDPLMGPRGALAGLVAVSAAAPFMPTWAALVSGAVAGLLLPLATYFVDHVLRFDDAIAAIASFGLPGFWGLLTVAIFADGSWGHSWNGVGGLPEQGVSGLIVATSFQVDSSQLGAQLWGAVALSTLGFLVPWGILKLLVLVFSLRLPIRSGSDHRHSYRVRTPKPSGQSQSASGSLDGAVNVDGGS